MGSIPATFALQPSSSQYAAAFSFEPASGTLQPGQVCDLLVTFRAAALGDIDEDFAFLVDDVPEPLRLAVRGKVLLFLQCLCEPC